MDECNWDSPGANPYRKVGYVHIERALTNYAFSDSVKQELLDKIKSMRNDATVYITKDDVFSAFGTASNLRDMHFGKNTLCKGEVTRQNWKDDRVYPALVYCSQSNCVAVPVVCENVSRIDYVPFTKEPFPKPKKVVHQVPEPSSALLLVFGLVALRKKLFT